MYFTARLLGIEEVAHRALFAAGERGDRTARRALDDIVRSAGVSAREFERLRKHELMLVEHYATRTLFKRSFRAFREAGVRTDASWRFPELIVNGRYAVSGSFAEDPGLAYRIANRLIRGELERQGAGAGPSNDEEFPGWMRPKSGHVLKQVVFGKALRGGTVWNAARNEMWMLSTKTGEVHRAYRLTGSGDRAYFRSERGTGVRYWHLWRVGNQFKSFLRADGTPQKYAAFALMDHLCAADTHWVQLRFRGRKTAFAFDRCEHGQGRVEGRNANGPVFGSWWLESGELKVAFAAELGSESWRWPEVAKQAGWEIPQESLTPWRFVEREAEEDEGTVGRSLGSER